jgi:hypothetical protein
MSTEKKKPYSGEFKERADPGGGYLITWEQEFI